jgi:hypothetical protein
MNFNRTLAIAASMVAYGALAHAGPSIDRYVTLSGFGTLGEVHSTYSQADFVGSLSQLHGVGHTSSWSPSPDSNVGVQADIRVTDGLTGVVQVISRDDVYGNYKPSVEWANLKCDFTPDLSVRLGRTVLPTFERSDIQNVGYALPWVRLPNEITYANSATHSDGVDVLYRVKTGTVTQNLQFQWGSTSEDYPGEVFHATDLMVISDTVQHGDTSVHLAYQSMKYTYTGVPPGKFRLASAGFTYDPGGWFVTGDSNYGHDSTYGDFFAWYLSGGIRIGAFTPYAIYSTYQPASTLPSDALGTERTVSAGVRWDFAKNFDFKLQLQQVTIETLNSPASFLNLQPGARVGDKANVLSLAVDFVF